MMAKIKFKHWNCILVQGYYSNNRIALQLIDEEDRSPVAKCTVNLPDEPLAEDEVAIKNWSENKGILEVLIDARIISPPHRTVKTGHCVADICYLLI